MEGAIALLGLQPHHLCTCQAIQDCCLHNSKQTWEDDQWLEVFHITRATTFLDLLDQPHPHVKQQGMNMQQPLPANSQLVIALLKLTMLGSLC